MRKDTENRLHTQDDAQVWTLTTGGKWKINKRNNLSVYAEYYGWDNTSDTDSRSETDGQTDPYQTYTEKYLYKETTATAKASYNFSTDKFSLGLGARFRYTHLKPRVEPANESFSREYADVLPYASVMYLIDPMKGHRLQLDYSRMAGYPGMSELNPGKRWTSEYEYSTGNPELEPRYEEPPFVSFPFSPVHSLQWLDALRGRRLWLSDSGIQGEQGERWRLVVRS